VAASETNFLRVSIASSPLKRSRITQGGLQHPALTIDANRL
jgi:hypothetical protein